MRREGSKYFHFTGFGRRAYRNLIYFHEVDKGGEMDPARMLGDLGEQ